jgi:hypothetical protein
VTACWGWSARLRVAVALATAPAPLAAQGADLPPPGMGSLRQDQVAVRLGTVSITVRVLPLDERVIRLLAPDTYASLAELKRSRTADIAAAARQAGFDSATVFVVTVFALVPNARFDPDQLYLSSQNAFLRPIGVVPLTPHWGEGQLGQRQQAVAIYLFQPGIPILQPFTVYYGDQPSTAWESTLRLLDGERARVLGRAASRP